MLLVNVSVCIFDFYGTSWYLYKKGKKRGCVLSFDYALDKLQVRSATMLYTAVLLKPSKLKGFDTKRYFNETEFRHQKNYSLFLSYLILLYLIRGEYDE